MRRLPPMRTEATDSSWINVYNFERLMPRARAASVGVSRSLSIVWIPSADRTPIDARTTVSAAHMHRVTTNLAGVLAGRPYW